MVAGGWEPVELQVKVVGVLAEMLANPAPLTLTSSGGTKYTSLSSDSTMDHRIGSDIVS